MCIRIYDQVLLAVIFILLFVNTYGLQHHTLSIHVNLSKIEGDNTTDSF